MGALHGTEYVRVAVCVAVCDVDSCAAATDTTRLCYTARMCVVVYITYSVLQCVAVCCSVLQRVMSHSMCVGSLHHILCTSVYNIYLYMYIYI